MRNATKSNTAPKPSAAPSALAPAHTPERFAELIGFHVESVRRLIRAGKIRALKFGSSWRIPDDEARRVLAEGLPR